MMPLNGRRQFLQGTLAAGCALCAASAISAEVNPTRRYYCAYGAVSVGEPENLIDLKQAAVDKLRVLLQSRSSAILEYLEAEDKIVPDFFGADAPIKFDPGTSAIAYTDFSRIDSAFIALGEGFIVEYARQKMLRIVGLLAHEEGHIYQIRSGINNGLANLKGFRIKHIELHADYMAGAYLAWRERLRPQSPASWLDDFFAELPGTPLDYSSYHGSPDERRTAFAKGRSEFAALSVRGGPPADAAALQGLKYIEKLSRA